MTRRQAMKTRISLRPFLLILFAGLVAVTLIHVVPLIQRARVSARQSEDMKALHHLGIALHKYHLDHDDTWPTSLLDPPFYSTLSPELQALVKNPALTYHRPGTATSPESPLLEYGDCEFLVSGAVAFKEKATIWSEPFVIPAR